MTISRTRRFSKGSAPKWSQSEDDILKTNYDRTWGELYDLLPQRSYLSIYHRLRKLGLKKSEIGSCPRWSDEDIAYLDASYGNVLNEELEKRLGRNMHAISEYARKRGLKMSVDEYGRTVNTAKNPSLRPLLEGGLQGYYWVGYLMADGYMNHRLNQVVLISAEVDKDHMARYAAFLNAECHRYMSLDGFYPMTRERRPIYRISVADKVNCLRLIERYDWKPQKTYNPPSSEILAKTLADPDAFLAFLIGFIDGDGSINKSGCRIRIVNHASWITFHDFLLDSLRRLCILDVDTKAKISKRDKSDYSAFNLPKHVAQCLKSFVNQHDLVVLARKWNKVIVAA